MYSVPPPNFIYCSYKITTKFIDDLGNRTSCIGTGFIVASGDRYALVTNRHVLDARYSNDKLHSSTRLVELRVLGKGRQGETFELHMNPEQSIHTAESLRDDIACIIDPRLAEGAPPGDIFHHFGIEALADDNFFSESLHPGEPVFYSGFPDPHDKLAQRPILRKGTVASDPRHSYSYSGGDEGARIAYEGFSSGGASGSPVWAASRSFKNYPGARTGALVGVNAGHISAKYGEHSGVSFFYKSTMLLDLLHTHGL